MLHTRDIDLSLQNLRFNSWWLSVKFARDKIAPMKIFLQFFCYFPPTSCSSITALWNGPDQVECCHILLLKLGHLVGHTSSRPHPQPHESIQHLQVVFRQDPIHYYLPIYIKVWITCNNTLICFPIADCISWQATCHLPRLQCIRRIMLLHMQKYCPDIHLTY